MLDVPRGPAVPWIRYVTRDQLRGLQERLFVDLGRRDGSSRAPPRAASTSKRFVARVEMILGGD